MAVQKRVAQIGFAKQTAKGAAAATAAYQIGVTDGNVVSADIAEDDLNVSWASRMLEGHDRTGITPGADFSFIVMPKTIGLLLLAAFGTVTTTVGTPNEHEFTPGAMDVPYHTLFARMGADYYRETDAKLNELELSWDQAGALKGKASFIGTDLSFLASAYTATQDERPKDGLFHGVGGTFEIDGASAVVKSGSVKIANNLEAVFGSDSVQPKEVFPGLQTIDLSLTIVPEDMGLWRKVVTGTTSGSTLSPGSTYGTSNLVFVADASTDLTLAFDRTRFLCDFPSVDTGGGAQEIALEGSVSGDGDVTVTLRNSVASY